MKWKLLADHHVCYRLLDVRVARGIAEEAAFRPIDPHRQRSEKGLELESIISERIHLFSDKSGLCTFSFCASGSLNANWKHPRILELFRGRTHRPLHLVLLRGIVFAVLSSTVFCELMADLINSSLVDAVRDREDAMQDQERQMRLREDGYVDFRVLGLRACRFVELGRESHPNPMKS